MSARRRGGLVAVRAASVVLLIAAVLASGAVLRAAPVGLGSRADELNSLRPLLHRKDVLFLTNDHFLQWELRGANTLYGSGLLYVPARLGEHPQKEGGQPVDADNYGSPDLDKVRYIVTQRSDYQSEIPPNFRLVRETPSFRVYHRRGRTPLREPLEPPGTPGTVADCGSARAKKYLSLYHWAGVLPRPVVSAGWKGSIATPGSTARLRLTLPRGRWDLSLQYVSTTRLTVSAPGLRRRLPPNFGVIVAYWPAGTLTSDGRPLTVTLKSDQRSWFGRLLGKPRATLAYGRPDYVPLWHAAFTRHGAKVERIPSSQACGRYADWFAPSGSHMTGR